MIRQNILPCPRCGKIPTIHRIEDPAEINKRYEITCNCTDGISVAAVLAKGPTEQMTIKLWNDKATRVIVSGNSLSTGADSLKVRREF